MPLRPEVAVASRSLRVSKRMRACTARAITSARANGSVAVGTNAMQSTGQGGRHSPQPVHSSAITVCMCLPAPTMASTGHAWMHLVQPMQVSSSIMAAVGDSSLPQAGSSGWIALPSREASAAMPSAPPGGQRLISASPAASASA
jgi:hypothetical protein